MLQVQQAEAAPAAEVVGQESEPELQLNLGQSEEWIDFAVSTDSAAPAEEAEPAAPPVSERQGTLFEVDLGVDSKEFGKETSEIVEQVPPRQPTRPPVVPDEVDLSDCFRDDDEELAEEVPLDESVDGFGEGELVMLDGSAPTRQNPTGETDFLPPSLGLEHGDESLDLDDPEENFELQSVELNLDDLDDDDL